MILFKIYLIIFFIVYGILFYWFEIQDRSRDGYIISLPALALASIWPLWAWIFIYAGIMDLKECGRDFFRSRERR